MNRFYTRLRPRRSASAGLAGLSAACLLAPMLLTGCGTGQIAQTTDQASAVNGAEGTAGDLALRNVRIVAAQTGDAIPAGSTVDLAFVASNQSVTGQDDQLTAISTDIGNVSLTGTKKVPAGGALIVAPPIGQGAVSPTAAKDLRSVEDSGTAAATLTLGQPISNGLTYNFTFEFREAGKISFGVPIAVESAESPGVPSAHR